ncbi:MAG: DNA methyltransferase [Nanoarchaeota archaeon]|nr:DNA methyltransferase [Nanoarchaeota archaeon]
METYIFILGRDPTLSILEIISYLQARNLNHQLHEHTEDYAAFSIQDFNPRHALEALGGTIKIARETSEFEEVYQGSENKVTYTVNKFTDNKKLVDDVEVQLRTSLREQGLKAFQKKNREKKPSKSSTIDIEAVVAGERVGIVEAVSNPKAYKKRDENRPHFEAARVISMRLARILINLSQAVPGDTLVDPFCGLGTILQEATLMKIQAVGIDSNKTMITQATNNLQWLGTTTWKLYPGDAQALTGIIKHADVAVTEPYLGPYAKKPLSMAEAQRLKLTLEQLYTTTLRQLKKIIKKRVVFIFPRFKTNENKRVELDIPRILRNSGWTIADIHPGFTLPLPYYHTKSIIERFIYVLE